MTELLVNVYRGNLVESRHFGDLAIVDTKGHVLWWVGDPERITFARSSAKPIQVLPLIESGAADFFHMSEQEIALTCASHSGEEVHVDLVRSFLSRIGISESYLKCGVHAPYHAASHTQLLKAGSDPTSVHNNCSGKHSGMLALAKFLGADLETYLNVEHPVQQLILSAVSELSETPKDQIEVATDGCGAPVFGLQVKKMALAFAKFADPSSMPDNRKKAMERITSAMTHNPVYVAGSDRFCTALMEAAQGTVVGKAGAEGVYCAGVLNHGLGLCVKIDDGNARAAYPSVVEALVQAGAVDATVANRLECFHHPELRNHQGTLVGRLSPAFTLKQNERSLG